MSTYEQILDYDYSGYDYLFGIDFGSTETKVAYHSFALEDVSINLESYPSICVYSCVNENYDSADFENWGREAEKYRDKFVEGIYVSKLCDKVDYLFDIKKNEQTAKDRLYLRAIIRYFKELVKEFEKIAGKLSRKRYVMTYPSDWTPEKVAYLRSLIQKAGIIDEQDHPGRLLMYSEGASVLRVLQTPDFDGIIKQGYTYMVCDMGGSKVKMSLFDIKEPLNTRTDIKGERLRQWDINYMMEPSQLFKGLRDIERQCEIYILSRLPVFVKRYNVDENDSQDGFLVVPGRLSDQKEYLGRENSFDRQEELDRKLYIRKGLVDLVMKLGVEDLCQEEILKNKPIEYPIHYLLQTHEQSCDNLAESTSPKEKLPIRSANPPESLTALWISPTELEKNVVRPICDPIIHYLESILQGTVRDSIETLALTGGFCFSEFLVALIKDTCNIFGLKVVSSPGRLYDVISGAIYKAMDKFIPRADTSKMLLDKKSSPTNSIENEPPRCIVFIDYGLKKTRVSYIYHLPGQPSNYKNINHIINWPGQSALDHNFPTVDIMLISGNQLDGSKKMISLKENSDHIDHILKVTQMGAICNKYYTFHKDKKSIIMFTHIKQNSEKKCTHIDVDDLRSSQNCSLHTHTDKKTPFSAPLAEENNITSKSYNNFNFTVTQKRISFREFSMIYFEYLTAYLYDYFCSKTGTENNQYQFCVTRDSFEEPVRFKLSDEDLHNIANEFGILSTDIHRCHDKLLVLERTQATAIFCREEIKGLNINELTTHLYTLQVQLTENRCTLMLNRFPFLREGVNVDVVPEREEWSGIYKYEESKRIPFNAMDIICNNLWVHVQKHQHTLLKRCGSHQLPHRFFNSNNMQKFKDSLYNFLSTADLKLRHGEKVNKICICKSDQEENCCRLYITNMDLLEFCFIPVIDELASKICTYACYVHLCQNVKISNVFVMGVFLFCRNQRDYSFLEDFLLLQLGKINALYTDDFGLHGMIKTTQITTVNAQNYDKQNGYINTADRIKDSEQDQEFFERIALRGSFMHGINPRNRLFERVASRTYSISITVTKRMNYFKHAFQDYLDAGNEIDDNLIVSTTCKSSNLPIRVTSDMMIHIIQKGSYLTSVSPNGEDFDKSFTITNSKEEELCVSIVIYALDENVETTWDLYESISESQTLHHFTFDYDQSSYPIVLKVRPSQTQSYKFWVEYGPNESTEAIRIQENILLKTNYGQHQD